MTIGAEIKALSAACAAMLLSLPPETKSLAQIAINRKIEALRAKCYADRANLEPGKLVVLTVARNICMVGEAKEKLFPIIPKAIFYKALDLLFEETTDPQSVIEHLAAIQKGWHIPEEQIATFMPTVQLFVRQKALGAIEKVATFAEAHIYNEAMVQEVSEWKAKLDECTPFFRFGLDADKLLGGVSSSSQFKATLSVVFAQNLEAHTQEECKKEFGIYFKLGSTANIRCDNPSQYIELVMKDIFDLTVRPSLGIAFCKRLAQTNFSFGQLLEAYDEFTRQLSFVCKYTVDEAKQILFSCTASDLQARNAVLLPPRKTAICLDARGHMIHLQPVNSEKLYREIDKDIARGYNFHDKGVQKDLKSEDTLLNKSIHYSTCARQGRRKNMEDMDLVTTITLHDGTEVPLFAVMDGHGGSAVSALLEIMLPTAVTTWLNAALQENSDNFELCFRNALKMCVVTLNNLIKNMSADSYSPGSNCIFSFIYKDRLFTVNVGDSRAVTSTGQQLSEDANQYSISYKNKVTKKRNGIVDHEGRVDGILTFSTFGSFEYKNISAFAGIHVLKLKPAKPGQSMKLLLTCDGITSLASSQNLIDALENMSHASEIVSKLYDMGAEDNLTAVLATIPYTI